MIDIYRAQYLEALRLRVGEKDPKYLTEERLDTEISSILMQLGMSLFLITRSGFCFFNRIKKTTSDASSHSIGINGPISLPENIIRSEANPSYGPILACDAKTSGEIKTIAERLYPIYRIGVFNNNCLSLALSHLTFAIYSKFPSQSFLSLCCCIEALLNSKGIEIKHTICERLALCLGKDKDDRAGIYRDMSDIYSTRSNIVHGNFKPLKKKVTTNDMSLHARSPFLSCIPSDQYSRLFEITVLLMNLFLRENKLNSIVIEGGDTSKKMTKYFNEKIFS
ncbi:MAG: hypothetical protein ACI9FB_004353 [Candidatus Azotimanducaceae bacterium]